MRGVSQQEHIDEQEGGIAQHKTQNVKHCSEHLRAAAGGGGDAAPHGQDDWEQGERPEVH
jgi:hypothetical protein